MEVVPSSPTGRSNHTLTWKIPLPVLFTSPRFHTHLPCPPLINAAKHSHPEPVQRTSLSSVLPHLFLSIILIKSIWKFLWGFLSISVLGNPRIPMPTKVICLYSISLTKLGMKIFYLKIPSVFQPSLSSFLSYWKTNELH